MDQTPHCFSLAYGFTCCMEIFKILVYGAKQTGLNLSKLSCLKSRRHVFSCDRARNYINVRLAHI